MSDELPHALEQKTIAISGVVASVPKAKERGERFRFDVEKILTKGAIVSKHISLNQYRANHYERNKNTEEDTPELNQFKAGERWLLSVCLKRPHGKVNPHGFYF
jgi:competence protein ComEC